MKSAEAILEMLFRLRFTLYWTSDALAKKSSFPGIPLLLPILGEGSS